VNSVTDFWSFFEGFCIMVIGIVISGVLALYGGMFLDGFITNMAIAGMDGGAGTVWDTTGNINIMINIFYFACCMPAIFGIAVFFLVATKRMKLDMFSSSSTSEYDNW